MTDKPKDRDLIKNTRAHYAKQPNLAGLPDWMSQNSILDLCDRLESALDRIKEHEDSPELPCGHVDTYLTMDDRGLHCSKCDRIYTDWIGMPDKMTALNSKLTVAVQALKKTELNWMLILDSCLMLPPISQEVPQIQRDQINETLAEIKAMK